MSAEAQPVQQQHSQQEIASRHFLHRFGCCSKLTTARINRTFAAFLASGALLSGSYYTALIYSGLSVSPLGWATASLMALALFAVAGGSSYYAVTLIDYEDSAVIAAEKTAAIGQNMTQLHKRHGAANLVKYIYNDSEGNYSINQLRTIFQVEEGSHIKYEARDNDKEILTFERHTEKFYTDLASVGIINEAFITCVRELREQAKTLHAREKQERAEKVKNKQLLFPNQDVITELNALSDKYKGAIDTL